MSMTVAAGQTPPASACPTSPSAGFHPPGAETPAPPAAAGAPVRMVQLPLAKTIAPAVADTSTVIKPDISIQISCGKTIIKTVNDVTFVDAAANGATRPLKMDILIPDEAGKHPLVIYVPGGGFVRNGKEDALNLRTFVAEAGFVVASINYRTALDGATYADGVADVKQAIRFLRAHAGDYGIDAAHVAIWGESAGGYLVAMTALTDGDPTYDQGANLDQNSKVQAVVDKFGPTDLSTIAADFDEEAQRDYRRAIPTLAYIGGLTPDGKLIDPASDPVNHLKGSAPPFLILHGTRDRIVSPSQSLRLHDALRADGDDSTRYLLEGADHGDLAFLGDIEAGLHWSNTEVMGVIVDFLHAKLR